MKNSKLIDNVELGKRIWHKDNIIQCMFSELKDGDFFIESDGDNPDTNRICLKTNNSEFFKYDISSPVPIWEISITDYGKADKIVYTLNQSTIVFRNKNKAKKWSFQYNRIGFSYDLLKAGRLYVLSNEHPNAQVPGGDVCFYLVNETEESKSFIESKRDWERFFMIIDCNMIVIPKTRSYFLNFAANNCFEVYEARLK